MSSLSPELTLQRLIMESNPQRSILLQQLKQNQILARQKQRNENVKSVDHSDRQISDHVTSVILDLLPNEIMQKILSQVEGTTFLR